MLLHALTMAAAALGQADAPADDADAELNRYYSAAMERLADQGEDYAKARTELRDAQRAWIKYRDAECGAVFTYWYPGSIARTMAADCSDRLTGANSRDMGPLAHLRGLHAFSPAGAAIGLICLLLWVNRHEPISL